MLGRELLMALAKGQRLRRLDKTARALGVFLDIHHSLPRAQYRGTRTADLIGASAIARCKKLPPPEKGYLRGFSHPSQELAAPLTRGE